MTAPYVVDLLADGVFEAHANGQRLGGYATRERAVRALVASAVLAAPPFPPPAGDAPNPDLAPDPNPGAPTTTDAEAGLLPQRWADVAGICFATPTGDGRDFTGCVWSWRTPGPSTLPLMMQTETDIAHWGAELVGFIESLTDQAGTVHATGRFYDTDEGRKAVTLISGGRQIGVSVDPGAVTATDTCVMTGEDGFCTEYSLQFESYEIIGLTITPFPGFATAAIRLDDGTTPTPPADAASPPTPTPPVPNPAVTASASSTKPARASFFIPEPDINDPRVVPQYGPDGEDIGAAMPLTVVRDDTGGRVLIGHLAYWGACHTGFLGECMSPPDSACSYAGFHTGNVLTAEGERVATGALVMRADHAPQGPGTNYATARDHYSHTGLAIADVRVIDGQMGPWVCGSIRPDVTDEQLRVIDGSSLSGDWRLLGDRLELISILMVNAPGFRIARELAASAGLTSYAGPVGRVVDDEPVSLVAAGVVQRCSECGKARAARAALAVPEDIREVLARIERSLGVIDVRTRPLIGTAAAAARARIKGTN